MLSWQPLRSQASEALVDLCARLCFSCTYSMSHGIGFLLKDNSKVEEGQGKGYSLSLSASPSLLPTLFSKLILYNGIDRVWDDTVSSHITIGKIYNRVNKSLLLD